VLNRLRNLDTESVIAVLLDRAGASELLGAREAFGRPPSHGAPVGDAAATSGTAATPPVLHAEPAEEDADDAADEVLEVADGDDEATGGAGASDTDAEPHAADEAAMEPLADTPARSPRAAAEPRSRAEDAEGPASAG